MLLAWHSLVAWWHPIITKRIPQAPYTLSLDFFLHLKQTRLFRLPSFDTYKFPPFTWAAETSHMRKEQAAVQFEKVPSTLQLLISSLLHFELPPYKRLHRVVFFGTFINEHWSFPSHNQTNQAAELLDDNIFDNISAIPNENLIVITDSE